MPERRTNISPTVLADLARRVHPEPELATNRLQNYSAYVLGGLWLVWILTAPALLVLLLFGANFTAQWLVAGAYLLSVSSVAIGVGLLVAGFRAHHSPQQMHYLLLGEGMLLATICLGILGFFGTSDRVSPWLPISASGILAVDGVGIGVYLVCTLHQHVLLRLLWLIALWSFSLSIVVNTILVQADRLPLPPTTLPILHTIQTIVQPLALGIYFLALFGNIRAKQK